MLYHHRRPVGDFADSAGVDFVLPPGKISSGARRISLSPSPPAATGGGKHYIRPKDSA